MRVSLRLVLVASLVAALLVMVGCASGSSEPQPMSLADLAAGQQDHDGTYVEAEGTVRSHDDPLHFWIEDDVPNRVELVPHEAVADLVGHEVRVEGEFSFADDRGRVITVDDVEVLRENPEL